MLDQPAQRVADGAAVLSGAGAVASWTLAEINTVVSIGAAGIGILTGLAALAWYVINIRRALRDRR